jgi:hypothetical protein
MKSFFFVLAQLMLVTIVYAFAYRAGYRDAKSKAMSVVGKFADPVTCLLDQLNASLEEAQEDEHPTSNSPKASKSAFGGSASGGSNVQDRIKKKVEL